MTYLSPAGVAVLQGPIIGRESEVERLTAAVRDAADGRGGVLLLTGEPGVGKTRLAEECEGVARAAGLVCVWGRCWESGGAPPFWPWSQVIRGLQRGLGDKARILPPALGGALGADGGPSPQGSLAGRFELFDAFADWMGLVSEEQPLWIGLEDLHGADSASLALLEALLAPLRTSRILIIATARDEVITTGDLSAVYRRIARHARTFPLSRLSRQAAERLLTVTLGDTDGAFIEGSLEATAGHPLYLVELVRLAQGSPEAAPLELIPVSVHNVLRQRLEGISKRTLEVLSRGALMGVDLDRAVLGCMFGEQGVELALTEALGASLVRRLGPKNWRLCHGMLRDVLLERLDAATLEAAHGAIAEALRETGVSVASRAHHLHRAGKARLEQALLASLEAAEAAVAQFAFEDALAHVAMARGGRPEVADEQFEARLRVQEGLALLGLGRVDEGLEACRAAAQAAERAGAAAVLAEAALAYGSLFRFATVDPKLVALLEKALDELQPGDSALRAQLLARLAAARQPDPEPARPIALARQAIAMADRVGEVPACVAVLRAACSALVDLAHPAERRELDQRHLDLALRVGLPTDALTARQRLAFDCMELGEIAVARAHLDEVARLAQTSAHPRYRWRVPALQALQQLWLGDLAETRSLIEQARTLGLASGDSNAASCHAFQLARWVEITGQVEGADAVADQLGRLNRGTVPGELMSAMARSRFLLHIGQTEAGLAAIDRPGVTAVLHMGDRTMLHGVALWASRQRDAELGREVIARLQGCEHEFLSDGVLALCWGAPVALVLAYAADACGELDAALRWAEAAARAAEEHGARPLVVEAHQLGAKVAGRREKPAAAATLSITPDEVPTFSMEGEVYCISWRGRDVRVQATKGLAVITHLVERPGTAVHVLDLMEPGQGSAPVDGGGAGEVLDRQARTAYRARAALLREQLEEAESLRDLGRVELLRAELEFLGAELGRGAGLGGRVRQSPGAEERARQAIRKQVRSGISRIAQVYPELAHYLERSIQTGRTCIFQP